MARFNLSVRNGKRWNPRAIATLVSSARTYAPYNVRGTLTEASQRVSFSSSVSSYHALSDSLPRIQLVSVFAVRFLFWGITPRKGFGRLVPLGCRHCCPCTCGLSTSSSLTALCGNLILRKASCLDAFSTYPCRTRLPGRAPGGTTGAPEVRPTRSSRTSVGTSQISCAHNR